MLTPHTPHIPHTHQQTVKERLLANNAKTYWVPAAVKENRFHNWLADAKASRQVARMYVPHLVVVVVVVVVAVVVVVVVVVVVSTTGSWTPRQVDSVYVWTTRCCCDGGGGGCGVGAYVCTRCCCGGCGGCGGGCWRTPRQVGAYVCT